MVAPYSSEVKKVLHYEIFKKIILKNVMQMVKVVNAFFFFFFKSDLQWRL